MYRFLLSPNSTSASENVILTDVACRPTQINENLPEKTKQEDIFIEHGCIFPYILKAPIKDRQCNSVQKKKSVLLAGSKGKLARSVDSLFSVFAHVVLSLLC